MKICDKCKSKEVVYKFDIKNIANTSGLASWEMDFCFECMEELEKIVSDYIKRKHD